MLKSLKMYAGKASTATSVRMVNPAVMVYSRPWSTHRPPGIDWSQLKSMGVH